MEFIEKETTNRKQAVCIIKKNPLKVEWENCYEKESLKGRLLRLCKLMDKKWYYK